MNVLAKIFSILVAITFIPSTTLAGNSTDIIPPTGLVLTPINSVHLTAVIQPNALFPDPGAGNESLAGFALTGYVSASAGPAVPNFYMSPGTTGTAAVRNITVPYTGNYKIGGMLIFFTSRANPPPVSLTLQISGGVGAYGSGSFNPQPAVGARTVIDLGTYLGASNVYLVAGTTMFLWMWVGSPSDTGWLYILPNSYVTLDSIVY